VRTVRGLMPRNRVPWLTPDGYRNICVNDAAIDMHLLVGAPVDLDVDEDGGEKRWNGRRGQEDFPEQIQGAGLPASCYCTILQITGWPASISVVPMNRRRPLRYSAAIASSILWSA
jgi:hypothetical protein